jgi:hypothetical protein
LWALKRQKTLSWGAFSNFAVNQMRGYRRKSGKKLVKVGKSWSKNYRSWQKMIGNWQFFSPKNVNTRVFD